jgi:hypothetical protein
LPQVEGGLIIEPRMGAFRIERMFHAVVVVGASLPACGSRTALLGAPEGRSGSRETQPNVGGAEGNVSASPAAASGSSIGQPLEQSGSSVSASGGLDLGSTGADLDASALLGAVDAACAPSQIFCTDYVTAIGCECRLSSPTGPNQCDAASPFYCPYHCQADPYGCVCFCLPLIR